MRILLIHDDLEALGGASRYIKFISSKLKDLGYDVRIFSYPKEIMNERQNLAFFSLKLYFLLKKEINKLNPDVIHINNTHKFQNSVYLACIGRNTIKTFHDYSFLGNYFNYLKVDKETILKFSDINNYKTQCFKLYKPIFNYGRILEIKLLNKFKLISPSKELIIHSKSFFNINYIRYPSFFENKKQNIKKLNKNKTNLLFVGYLIKNKGVHVLIDSLKYLPDNYSLDIVGDGPDKNLFEELANSDKRIKFIGWRKDSELKKIYQNADVLIVPSIEIECSPLVIIEAMQFGLPIIGSNVPGVRESIFNNKIGLLFERGNSKDLAYKIKEITAYPNVYNLFSNNSIPSSKKYRSLEHLKKLLEFYLMKKI